MPAMVKVFAVCSTVEIVPWKGIARTLAVVVLSAVVVFSAVVALSAGVDFVLGEVFGLAAGVGEAAKAAIGAQ